MAKIHRAATTERSGPIFRTGVGRARNFLAPQRLIQAVETWPQMLPYLPLSKETLMLKKSNLKSGLMARFFQMLPHLSVM